MGKYYLNTERTFLFSPNVNVVMRAEITGNPPVDHLIRAAEEAMRYNESLNCKIVLSQTGEAWYERCDQPANSVTVSDKDWQTLVREQETKPFMLADGELIRIFILTQGSNPELLMIAHHLAGDGLSFVYLIEDIMNALSGKPLSFKPLHLVNIEDFPKGSRMSPLVSAGLNRISREWQKNRRVFTLDDFYGIYRKYWNNHHSIAFTAQLSQRETDTVVAKAKQADVSINSYITAAFLRAFADQAVIGVAVDCRTKGYRGMANHTTGIAVTYRYNEKQSFAKNAQAVHKLIYKELNNKRKRFLVLRFIDRMDGPLLDAVCMNVFGGYENKTVKYVARLMNYDGSQRDIGISNLTRLDIPIKYGEYVLENFVFVPPVIPYSKHIVGVATLGEQMSIVLNVMEDADAAFEQRFFDKAINYLKETE